MDLRNKFLTLGKDGRERTIDIVNYVLRIRESEKDLEVSIVDFDDDIRLLYLDIALEILDKAFNIAYVKHAHLAANQPRRVDFRTRTRGW